MTRDLEAAKSYFHKRYAEAPAARYGLVASSRDKILAEWCRTPRNSPPRASNNSPPGLMRSFYAF